MFRSLKCTVMPSKISTLEQKNAQNTTIAPLSTRHSTVATARDCHSVRCVGVHQTWPQHLTRGSSVLWAIVMYPVPFPTAFVSQAWNSLVNVYKCLYLLTIELKFLFKDPFNLLLTLCLCTNIKTCFSSLFLSLLWSLWGRTEKAEVSFCCYSLFSIKYQRASSH